MFDKLVLVATLLSVLGLCVRTIKRTKGRSLLVWHVLAFVLIVDVATLFFERVHAAAQDSGLAIAWLDAVVVDRMILSLILVNLVVLVYLILLQRRMSRVGMLVEETPYVFTSTPRVFWPAVMIVLVGVFIYAASPAGQLILQYGNEGIGDYRAYYLIRYEMSNIAMPVPIQYIYTISLATMLPLLTLYSLQRFLTTRSAGWLVRWLLLLSMLVIVSIMRYQKAPIVTAALCHAIVLSLGLRRRSGTKGLSVVWIIAAMIGLFFVVDRVYQVLGATADSTTSLQMLFDRWMIIPMTTAYNHFAVFPDMHPHTYYAGSRTLNLLLAGGQRSVSGDLAPERIASEILTGMSYNMNTGFLGNNWAAFGFIGVVQGACVVFGVLLFWDLYLLRTGFTAQYPVIALLAFFGGNISNIYNVGMGNLLTLGGFLFAPLFYLLLFRDIGFSLSRTLPRPKSNQQLTRLARP